MLQVPVKIRNGFPLIATFSIQPAEPDVGIMSSYIEELYFTTLRGKSADFLKITTDEESDVEQQIWTALGDGFDEYL